MLRNVKLQFLLVLGLGASARLRRSDRKAEPVREGGPGTAGTSQGGRPDRGGPDRARAAARTACPRREWSPWRLTTTPWP